MSQENASGAVGLLPVKHRNPLEQGSSAGIPVSGRDSLRVLLGQAALMDLADAGPSQQTTAGSSSGMSSQGQPASLHAQPYSPQQGCQEGADTLPRQDLTEDDSLDAAVQKVLDRAKVTSEKNRKVL